MRVNNDPGLCPNLPLLETEFALNAPNGGIGKGRTGTSASGFNANKPLQLPALTLNAQDETLAITATACQWHDFCLIGTITDKKAIPFIGIQRRTAT